MPISSTPVLVAIELAFVAVLAWRCGHLAREPYKLWSVYIYLAWVTAYGVITSILGARGFYVSDDLLEWLPGFWLQLITVAVCVGPVILFAGLRNGLRRIVDTTPGRMLLSEILPRHPRVPFESINQRMSKKEITHVIDLIYRHCGQ